jgi:hypothetical protein
MSIFKSYTGYHDNMTTNQVDDLISVVSESLSMNHQIIQF